MNSTEYKRYHESFMQNNHGSSALHTFLCICFTVQCTLICAIKLRSNGLARYLSEYLIIVLPTIVAHTIMSNYIYELNFGISGILLYEILTSFKLNEIGDILRVKNNFINGRIHSITCLRGLTYLITIICILAVDFKDFPRNLAKTENYGYSLMDTGVGLFILISGLVHKDITKNNYVLVVKSNTKLVLILSTLGVMRYLSVKQLDYQNHVTEYGVHWNFFFTVAVCKFLSTIILLISPQCLLLSALTIGIHEYLLYGHLQSWVFSKAPRTSFIDANKEGISSSLGFVALYLFAVYLKKVLNNKSANRCYIMTKLFLSSFVLLVCSYVINEYRPTSRTLANAGYFFYLTTLFTIIQSTIYFLEILFSDKENAFSVPLVLIAINDNGLLFFLVANVTTGLINMSLRTLFLPSIATFIILNLYMMFTISLIVYVNKKGIKL